MNARRRPVMWQVMSNEHRFGLFFIGSGLSNIGTWCHNLASILLIYRLTGSTLMVGLVAVAQFSWPVILTAWVGAAADRFDRRAILTFTQVVSAVVSAGLAAATMTGIITVPQALVAIAALGVLQAFQAPAQLALVSLLVPKEQLELGLSLSSTQFNLARAIGPMLASGIIAVWDIGAAFAFNAVSYLAYVLLLRFLRPRTQSRPTRRVRLREVLVTIRRSPVMVPLLVLGFIVSGATDVVNTLGPALSEQIAGDDRWTGAFVSAFGLGAVVGAIWLTPRLLRFRRRLPWTIGLQAFGMTVLAFAPTLWLAITGAAVFGIGFITSANRLLAAVQSLASPDMLGRVTAVWLMAFLGGRAFYALLGGAVADAAGPRVAGALVAVSLVVAAAVSRLAGNRDR